MKIISGAVAILILVSCSKEKVAENNIPCSNVAISDKLVGSWIWEECANYAWGESHTYPGPSEVKLTIFLPNDTVVYMRNGEIISVTNYIVADTFHYTNQERLFINHPNDSSGTVYFRYYRFSIRNNKLTLSPDISDGPSCSYRRCN